MKNLIKSPRKYNTPGFFCDLLSWGREEKRWGNINKKNSYINILCRSWRLGPPPPLPSPVTGVFFFFRKGLVTCLKRMNNGLALNFIGNKSETEKNLVEFGEIKKIVRWRKSGMEKNKAKGGKWSLWICITYFSWKCDLCLFVIVIVILNVMFVESTNCIVELHVE